jgi:hypothetical protein
MKSRHGADGVAERAAVVCPSNVPRSPEPEQRRRGRLVVPALLCIAVYCVLAAFIYGVHSPVSSTELPPCGCGDIASQVWFQEWPAYALSSGHNPLVSAFAGYPNGVNLMNNTAAPLLGIVFAPVTWLLGPLASFSLICRLGLALSGISMCFVLRRWTTWWPAAFVGGLLYAFSPFLIAQAGSHPYLTFAPLPPLVIALLDEIVIRRRHPMRNGVLLGAVLAAQLLISPELLAITGLLAALALVVVALRHPVGLLQRARILGTGLAATVVTFMVLAGYPLWVFFRGPYYISGPPHPGLQVYHSHVLSLIYPTTLQRIGLGSWGLRGNDLAANSVERADYLGVTLLCLLAFILVRFWRDGRIQLFTLVAMVAWSITLGRFLYIGLTPHPGIKLPYNLLWNLPVLDGAIDVRYSFAMYLAVSVILAVGVDRLRGEGLVAHRTPRMHRQQTVGRRLRIRTAGVTAAIIIALVPLIPAVPYTSTRTTTPPVFTSATSPVGHGEVVLSYPVPVFYEGTNDQALLWQAAGKMRFKLIGFPDAIANAEHHPLLGAGLLVAPEQTEDLLVWGLYGEPSPPPPDNALTRGEIRTFLARYHVGAVTVVPGGEHWQTVIRYFTAALGVPPRHFGQTLIWPRVQDELARVHHKRR